MNRCRRSLILSFLAVACAAPAASAGLVTWEFGGVITAVDDPLGIATGLVDVGSPFSGSFTFDPTTPDTHPDLPRLGRFNNAIVDLDGVVGNLAFSGAGTFNSIRVFDRIAWAETDSYNISVVDLMTPMLGETSDLSFILQDSTGEVFSDDSLPAIPPHFDSTFFRLQTASENVVLTGEITSVVPEPSALVLLVVGVVPFLLRKSHRRRGGRPIPFLSVLLVLGSVSGVASAQWSGADRRR